ncbi:MAG: hypothetical protein ACREOO_17700 [bacterium]
MKPQRIPANGAAHLQQASQLLYIILVLSGFTAAPIFAQDIVSAHASLAATRLILGAQVTSPEIHEDEFQATIAPSDEVSSSNMVGQPAEALPCEEHIRAERNDTIPSVATASQTPAAVPATVIGDDSDQFLMDKIQAVQRMIRLMELKEEIILEKARFELKLVDLQKKIENR